LNSIWNKNLQAFKTRFPGLAELYGDLIKEISSGNKEETLFSFYKLFQAKNGSLTAEENGVRLHSSYNPQKEADSAAEQLAEKNKSTLIFMGFGLGYQVNSLCKRLKQGPSSSVKKIVLIEPDPLHFFAALYYCDWSEVFNYGPLVIAAGCPIDSIMALLEDTKVNLGASGVSDSYLFRLAAFENHAKDYFDATAALIERNRSKNDINAATYKKFEKLWVRNSMKNLVQLSKCSTVNEHAKEVAALPLNNKNFILIAAGPSLEALLPKLRDYKEKAVLVCVETALHALLKEGIEPDYIVITDPQYYAYRHLAGLSSPSSTLICPLSVYPSVFRFNCRQILLCSEMFPVSSYFEKKLGSFGDLGAGGSVASSAWNLCRLLGARNIYLAGLDLSYPRSQTHIKGSSAEQSFHTKEARLIPYQNLSSSSIFSAQAEYACDYDGNPVLTDSRMKMFAWWFESRFAACPEVTTWTLSRSSMKIPGVKTLEENWQPEETKIIYKKDKKDKEKPQEKRLSFTKALADFDKDLKTLTELVNQAVEKCIIAAPSLEKELAQLEAEITASPLFEIIRLAKTNKDNPLELYSQLQKTLELYRSFAPAPSSFPL